MKKAIRDEYADQGVDAYYRTHANVYENPHYPYIKALLTQNQHRIDYSKALDLSAGGGEVTEILRGLLNLNQEEAQQRFIGTDPFTFKLYEKNTGCPCLPLSFDDIVKGKLAFYQNYEGVIQKIKYKTRNVGPFPPETGLPSVAVFEPFSSIICSFAMHLCDEKQLYPLVNQLFTYSENIIIITPHKRPALETLTNVTLNFDDFVLTERGKKVFLKSYSNTV
jgi:hypothetical protein